MSEGSSDSGFCARDNEDQQTSRMKKEKRRIGKYKKKHLDGAFIFGEKKDLISRVFLFLNSLFDLPLFLVELLLFLFQSLSAFFEFLLLLIG